MIAAIVAPRAQVGELYVRPFVATDGFYKFRDSQQTVDFLTELFKAARNESRFLLQVHRQLGAGLDASPSKVSAAAQAAPAEASHAYDTSGRSHA